MSSKLVVEVVTPGPYIILGNEISESYEVQDAEIMPFARDAQLRALALGGAVRVMAFNCVMERDVASDWLMRVASGNIVYG